MSEGKQQSSPQSGADVGWRQEALAIWRSFPNRAMFGVLLVAWLLLFQFLGSSTFGYVDTPSLLRWMYNAYNSPFSEDQHGDLIPFVVLGLMWWKRKELEAASKGIWLPALIGLGAGLVLHVLGYVVQQPRISIIGFFIGLYFLSGLTWGKSWLRRIFFPFILFVFCIPIGSLAESITFPLRMIVTHISVAISQGLLGIDVVRDGTRIFDARRTFQYDVAPACSGIRSLISLLALTTIYGFVTFERSWKRVLTMGLAVPLAVAGNVVRITTVIIAAEAFGQTAGSWVHDYAGFITFAVAIACVLLLGHWLREDRQTGGQGGAL
ncbi:MAG: exosortase/archaeosortase family protein [Candidatus Omnitrophica bacterium]|nr:exosortase/archaeosortase family protein [Candidatus Omnitrophota bacterium]